MRWPRPISCLVPTGASFLEFESTGRFFRHAARHLCLASKRAKTSPPARLGGPVCRSNGTRCSAIVTRYDGGQQAEFAALMQAYLGTVLSPYRQDFTALVGQAGEQVAGIYEADYRDFNRETYVRGRAAL